MIIGTTAVVGVGALVLIKAGEPLRADAGEYLSLCQILSIVDEGVLIDEFELEICVLIDWKLTIL